MSDLFSNDLSVQYPLIKTDYPDDYLVVSNKNNAYQKEVMSIEDFQELNLDSRLFDIITFKTFKNQFNQNYCTLILSGERVEISVFTELKGIHVSLK